MIRNKKLIKSSALEDAFTVYPWSKDCWKYSDRDLGLSYAVEAYGEEFLNLDDSTLNDLRDTLIRYFDDEAYVRDWNINYPDDQIEEFSDIMTEEDLSNEELARYFDYERFGRDIRLENNMIWDDKRECWFSGNDTDDYNEDDVTFLGSSKGEKGKKPAENYDSKAYEDEKENILRHTNKNYDSVDAALKDMYAHKNWIDRKPSDETEHEKTVRESRLKAVDDIIEGLKNGDKKLLDKFVKEENGKKVVKSSQKPIKSAVDGGWRVDSSDVPEALDLFVEYVGEETALEEIARAMGTDVLEDNIDYVAQQWGIAEDIEGLDAWDAYEKAKEIMGISELFTNLTQAAGYDELAEDLAFIFRMYDFREWDSVTSSRKSIKSRYQTTPEGKLFDVDDYLKKMATHDSERGVSIDNFFEFKALAKDDGYFVGRDDYQKYLDYYNKHLYDFREWDKYDSNDDEE
jgi:hypothetical protein